MLSKFYQAVLTIFVRKNNYPKRAGGLFASKPSPAAHLKANEIFVSYSRRDVSIVRGLLKLYEVTDSTTFLDTNSIPAGANWREAIESAIQSCDTILIFWCGHSVTSNEVEREYKLAIEHQKRIVPVLMDDTELPMELAEVQYIDLREWLSPHETLIANIDSRPAEAFDFLQRFALRSQSDPVFDRMCWASDQLKSSLKTIFGSPLRDA